MREETRLALLLIVLVCVRPGNIRFAEWAEIDREKRERQIPAAKMKMRAAHIVPLSDWALELAHYQFEAIHPFTDGNGRTGRILNSLLLIEKNLLSLPILYLSRYIIQHKADYYRLLLAVTESAAWEEWIMYILKGVEDTAYWTIAKIEAIKALAESTREFIRHSLPAIYSRELVDLLFEQPYTRIANLESAGIAKRQTASKYLKELVEIGVWSELSIGRDKLFIHPKLMGLLQKEDNLFAAYL